MGTRFKRGKTRLLRSAILLALAVALLCGVSGTGLAISTSPNPTGAIPYPAEVQPIVTIQGNAVINDAGKPTGFYEVALCVRTLVYKNTDPTATADPYYGRILDKDTFEALKKLKAEGSPLTVNFDPSKYEAFNNPVQNVSAALIIDTDIMTPVTWTAAYPTYTAWDPTGAGSYAATAGSVATDDGYDLGGGVTKLGRGLDLTLTSDETTAGMTVAEKLASLGITDISAAKAADKKAVALETAKIDQGNVATALVEDYDNTGKALLTLQASIPLEGKTYEDNTPLVVVRFAYDLKRFSKTLIPTGAGEHPDFGVAALAANVSSGVKAVTYLASNAQAAASTVHQVVWYEGMASNKTDGTAFYFYHGADSNSAETDKRTIQVVGVGEKELTYPKTGDGAVVLAQKGTDYDYFLNLLKTNGTTLGTEGTDSLRFKYVNEKTFKSADGGKGGTIVLFYDWDDSLIGSLIVGDGDVRADVNAYVENNLVHPDLRTGALLTAMGGSLPDYVNDTITPGSNAEKYQQICDSLAREHTYRGKYDSKVGGGAGSVSYTEDPNASGYDATLVGKEYPLTNKLDYAFYRRVNTVTTVTTAAGAKTEYYTVEPLSNYQDAALYPWVYGWAVVEDTSALNVSNWQVRRDAAKVEDTWTTIGVGELESVNPQVTQVDPVVTTAPAGGTLEVNRPAWMDELSPAPTDPTTYEYKTSDASGNSYLRFADFSDMSTLTKNGRDTVIVKAVYEPGESLLKGTNYRMVKQPYYNKLNASSASMGGAYTVDITLERSALSGGNVRGVSRIHSPAIRQDTTADQWWIEYDDGSLVIDHDVPSPTQAVANSKTETTYTNVYADNGEEISFQLVLSARQNKVDYRLIEKYGFNFVGGGQRSETNIQKSGADYVLDNYNYRVDGDSDTTDKFYDCIFDTKDGSRGFVLYCTLNNIMEMATKCNNGEITKANFGSYAGYRNLVDVNLRDSAQQEIDYINEAAVQTKILAAAAACATQKNDPNYWDAEHDCAQLTYHQLQHYILKDELVVRDGPEVSPSSTLADHYKWCHLHDDCAALSGKKPKSWDNLISAVKGTDGYQLKDIDELDLTGIEDITHLRTTSSGGTFASVTAFKNAFKDAVDAGCETWAEVQYYIVHNKVKAADEAAALAEAKDNYWWYDGAKSNEAPITLTGLVKLVQTEGKPLAGPLPDGRSKEMDGVTPLTTWPVKLKPIENVFDGNTTTALTDSDEYNSDQKKVSVISDGWKKMTHNLVKDYRNYNVGDADVPDGDEKEGTGVTYRWTTYNDSGDPDNSFLAALKKAIAAAPAGVEPSDDKNSYYWEKIQYMMLHPAASWPVHAVSDSASQQEKDDAAAIKAELDGYWWKDGGKRLVVSNMNTLLKAARQAAEGGDRGPLERVSWDVLSGPAFSFRKPNPDTTDTEPPYIPYTEAELGALKTKIEAAAKVYKTAGDPTSGYMVTNWNDLQYYLLHDDIVSNAHEEARYYWWKDGGTGTATDFSTGGSLEDRLDMLFMAIIRSTYGDPVALKELEEHPDRIFTYFAMLRDYPDTTNTGITLGTDGLPTATVDETTRKKLEFPTLSDFLPVFTQSMRNYQIAQSLPAYKVPVANWWQMSWSALHGGQLLEFNLTTGSDYDIACTEYWWHDKAIYEVKAATDPAAPLVEAMGNYLNGTDASGAALMAAINAKDLTNKYYILRTKGGTEWKSTTVKYCTPILEFLMNDAKTNTAYYDTSTGKLTLTWAQVQYYLGTAYIQSSTGKKAGTLTTHEDALKRMVNEWGWKNKKDGGYIPDMFDISGIS